MNKAEYIREVMEEQEVSQAEVAKKIEASAKCL